MEILLLTVGFLPFVFLFVLFFTTTEEPNYDWIKNMNYRQLRKVASRLSVQQKVAGRDLRKQELMSAIILSLQY